MAQQASMETPPAPAADGAAAQGAADGARRRDFLNIAAVSFAREHPMLRRAGQVEPAPIDHSAELLKMGSAFIANYIHGEAPGAPSQHVRWVADVFARLFFTYISMPPTDPDFADDAELRRFACEVLTPMVERAVG